VETYFFPRISQNHSHSHIHSQSHSHGRTP
jgi:hypothetical protein